MGCLMCLLPSPIECCVWGDMMSQACCNTEGICAKAPQLCTISLSHSGLLELQALSGIHRKLWSEMHPVLSSEFRSCFLVCSQVSQKAFSRSGTTPRGDTSGWTSTPAMRAKMQEQEQSQLLHAGSQKGAPMNLTPQPPPAQNRPGKKSLLEQHLEAQEKAKKSKKSKKNSAGDNKRHSQIVD